MLRNSVNFTYRGFIVPVFTPFNNDVDQSLNLTIIPEYAQYLVSKKIDGVLVHGTTGEGTSLTLDERKKVAETWAKAVKVTKQHLMIQIGGANLKDVKELASHAERIGADSLLCLPELYYRPSTEDELINYLRMVGESAPKTPLLYYHYPAASNVNVNMGKFLKTVADKIPTFSGIKYTSSDLEEGYQALIANEKLALFLGSDTLMSAACTIGIDSFITTSLNFVQEPALEILEFGKGNKDLKSARKNQELITKIVKTVTSYGEWVETMKIAMSLTTKLFMGPPRAPINLLTREDIEDMAKKLADIGISVDKTAVIKLH